MTCFPGMSWEYIDAAMTFPRYLEIMRYQKAHPPVHIMVAAYLGVNKSDAPLADGLAVSDAAPSLFDLFPQGPTFKG